MDIELLEKFKKKVEMESTYDKLLSRKAIDTLIDYFDVDVEEIHYSKTIFSPKELALSFYQVYFPEYYEIILDGILTGKILISNSVKQSVTYLDTGEAQIKTFNTDKDVFEIVHEFAHYIDLHLYPHLVGEYILFSEVVSFYFEKCFEKIYQKYYLYLIHIRRNNRLFYECEMLKVIRYMLEYEDYYKQHGNIDAIIDEDRIKLIMSYKSNNTVNTLLKYPLANLISNYMIINDIKMRQNIDEYIMSEFNLFELMGDNDVRKSIMVK